MEEEIIIPETQDIDEMLTEDDALAQAAEQGIEFEDFYTLIDDPENREFKTLSAAKKASKGRLVVQNRRQKNS